MLLELLDRWRRVVIVVLHLPILVALNYAALWLRFDGNIDPDDFLVFVNWIPWIVAIRMTVFAAFRLYAGFWRYAGIRDGVLTVVDESGQEHEVSTRDVIDVDVRNGTEWKKGLILGAAADVIMVTAALVISNGGNVSVVTGP